MFPPSMTRDKEQEVDGETEYQRKKQGCKLQKDYTLEHVGDTSLKGGNIQVPKDQRLDGQHGSNGMRLNDNPNPWKAK